MKTPIIILLLAGALFMIALMITSSRSASMGCREDVLRQCMDRSGTLVECSRTAEQVCR